MMSESQLHTHHTAPSSNPLLAINPNVNNTLLWEFSASQILENTAHNREGVLELQDTSILNRLFSSTRWQQRRFKLEGQTLRWYRSSGGNTNQLGVLILENCKVRPPGCPAGGARALSELEAGSASGAQHISVLGVRSASGAQGNIRAGGLRVESSMGHYLGLGAAQRAEQETISRLRVQGERTARHS
ncbi:hypothetical protein CYMTET_36261 [Cymbomonas tetramitiformis]|uniref:Uncharacterized protein n=1 Tax=Cymbomonas tetramitiformis TaxID=36881 RepID=A0AAE0CHN9_9CHLO|nr:hypothetical protein CYMTET_36261 [Cymbomonas tetramitiformis]